MAGLRDRALLLLGFAGALRHSELVGIDREHLRFTSEGLRLTLPSSKADQQGRGLELGFTRGKRVETYPARTLEAWLAALACDYGPVFGKVDRRGKVEYARLSGEVVRTILASRAKAAEITVHSTERLSPHGPRAGLVTEAQDEQVMDHTGHRDLKTMCGYIHRFVNHEKTPS